MALAKNRRRGKVCVAARRRGLAAAVSNSPCPRLCTITGMLDGAARDDKCRLPVWWWSASPGCLVEAEARGSPWRPATGLPDADTVPVIVAESWMLVISASEKEIGPIDGAKARSHRRTPAWHGNSGSCCCWRCRENPPGKCSPARCCKTRGLPAPSGGLPLMALLFGSISAQTSGPHGSGTACAANLAPAGIDRIAYQIGIGRVASIGIGIQ